MRRSLIAIAILLVLIGIGRPIPAAAQFPGELSGRVTDAETAAPVEGAVVELPDLGRTTRTDGAGAFRFRALEPGEYRILIRRPGYSSFSTSVGIRNGRTTTVDAALRPAPIVLESVRATAERTMVADGTRLTRTEIEAAGARTAADVVERMPGVVVRSTGATGAETVSIRGSAPDAVLVLVDGAPLNDPVTGEADLSTVPAASIEAVTVLPGARTARYGPRAQAGVVLIETRAPGAAPSAALQAGSLEERGGRVEAGLARGAFAASAGGSGRSIEGAFDYVRDPNDPTRVRRTNADLEEWSAFGAASARIVGGDVRLRGGWDALERGIPGLGHTPSERARQEMGRGRASLSWRRTGEATSLSALVSGAVQRLRYADPVPPFGNPYDDTARVRSLDVRLEADRAIGGGWLRGFGGGVQAATQHVDAGALSETAPRTRTDLGAFAHASASFAVGGREVGLVAEGRIDRDGVTENLYATRALTATAAVGPVQLQIANRSSYSPPSLGDQFFREGVGVVPNPDLRPERVPNEWEVGASVAEEVGGIDLSAQAAAYAGDVRGMIVWLPDFRFQWSPRNRDVRRRGVDARLGLGVPAAGVHLSGAYSLARVTWDRGDGDDGVQVLYRPRHAGSLGAEWARGGWRADVQARYTGARWPNPSAVNELPGFWSLDAGAARDWRARRWLLTAAVRVDRLLDETEPLIAGYPEPGRQLRVELRVRRAETNHTH
jgi:vitamin B12 transporter